MQSHSNIKHKPIRIEFGSDAPKTADNFITLASGLLQRRHLQSRHQGIHIQGGDPTGRDAAATNGSGGKFPANQSHVRSIKGRQKRRDAMAKAGPNTRLAVLSCTRVSPLPRVIQSSGRRRR